MPVPSAQFAQHKECIRAVQGRDSQGKPCPPCHPGQWAPCQGVGNSWLLQVAAKVPSVPVCPVALSTPCRALLCLLNQGAGPRYSEQITLRDTLLLEHRVCQNRRLLGTMHLLN